MGKIGMWEAIIVGGIALILFAPVIRSLLLARGIKAGKPVEPDKPPPGNSRGVNRLMLVALVVSTIALILSAWMLSNGRL
jgi:hypothetical protein